MIHGLGDLVRRMPREVLGERLGVELASQLPRPARVPLGRSEHVVWKRDRCLHTWSVTSTVSPANPPVAALAALAAARPSPGIVGQSAAGGGAKGVTLRIVMDHARRG